MMNESSHACCEHYQSGGWMNTLSCKAQLLFSCLTACLSSCLSTRSPDYLPTYRDPFVQIKRGKDGGEAKFYSFSPEFVLRRRCVEVLYLQTSPLASPANSPAFFYYSVWQSISFSTCLLKYLGSSVSLFIPLCSLNAECLPLPDISISRSYGFQKSFLFPPKKYFYRCF